MCARSFSLFFRAFAKHSYAPAATGRRADPALVGPEIMRAKTKASLRLAVECGCVAAAELIGPHVALAWDMRG